MKRIFTVIALVVLIFSLCCVSVYATERDTPSTDTELGEVAEEIGEPVDGEVPAEEEAEAFYSEWIDKITDSTMWINIGSVAVACLGVLGTVLNKFKTITGLISKKADTGTVIDTVKSSVSEICGELNKELDEVKEKLSESQDNEERLLAILTIFITNAKINANAKAEIMSYLTGTKKMAGSVIEIVERANAAIAEAQAVEERPETPALDAIVSENDEYMKLG